MGTDDAVVVIIGGGRKVQVADSIRGMNGDLKKYKKSN